MTFKEGVMPYLCFIKLINDEGYAWQDSLITDMVHEEDKKSKKNKERLILWAYKKKLFNTKDLRKGIWLTSKGKKYVEKNASDEDWENGQRIFTVCVQANVELEE